MFGEDAPFYFDFRDVEPSWQSGSYVFAIMHKLSIIQLVITRLFFSLQGNLYTRSRLENGSKITSG